MNKIIILLEFLLVILLVCEVSSFQYSAIAISTGVQKTVVINGTAKATAEGLGARAESYSSDESSATSFASTGRTTETSAFAKSTANQSGHANAAAIAENGANVIAIADCQSDVRQAVYMLGSAQATAYGVKSRAEAYSSDGSKATSEANTGSTHSCATAKSNATRGTIASALAKGINGGQANATALVDGQSSAGQVISIEGTARSIAFGVDARAESFSSEGSKVISEAAGYAIAKSHSTHNGTARAIASGDNGGQAYATILVDGKGIGMKGTAKSTAFGGRAESFSIEGSKAISEANAGTVGSTAFAKSYASQQGDARATANGENGGGANATALVDRQASKSEDIQKVRSPSTMNFAMANAHAFKKAIATATSHPPSM